MFTTPKEFPEPGFYYHYKHNQEKGVGDYAYEFLSVGFHTETGEAFVNYRPLYREASVYKASLEMGVPANDTRPLNMWMENVTKNGETILRFRKINDPSIISQLKGIRAQMYL